MTTKLKRNAFLCNTCVLVNCYVTMFYSLSLKVKYTLKYIALVIHNNALQKLKRSKNDFPNP